MAVVYTHRTEIDKGETAVAGARQQPHGLLGALTCGVADWLVKEHYRQWALRTAVDSRHHQVVRLEQVATPGSVPRKDASPRADEATR